MIGFECVFGDRVSTFGVLFALISGPNKLPIACESGYHTRHEVACLIPNLFGRQQPERMLEHKERVVRHPLNFCHKPAGADEWLYDKNSGRDAFRF